MDMQTNEINNGQLENLKKYALKLIDSKNIILRGAPGTGKTYLAREIATYIASDGKICEYSKLSEEQKEQIEFVQFHPSYDYTDFVEGLRPKIKADRTMVFELEDEIFKRFVNKAKTNIENSKNPEDKKRTLAEKALYGFLDNVDFNKDIFKTLKGTEFKITGYDDEKIYVFAENNPEYKEVDFMISDTLKVLENDGEFLSVTSMAEFLGRGKGFQKQKDSYLFIIYNIVREKLKDVENQPENPQNYIFIIDEINRGEISKIFGELFFSIDPGYRGKAGEVSTQYSNLHSDVEEKFYIPENVYIIGTMNDIDRSVDSFDFAMRRRFRFIEIKADDRLEMLYNLDNAEEAIKRMKAINNAISEVEGLNENYHIGPSYFLKLKEIDYNFDKLWTDYLKPLLNDYIQGMYDEKAVMETFEKAYYKPESGNVNENS